MQCNDPDLTITILEVALQQHLTVEITYSFWVNYDIPDRTCEQSWVELRIGLGWVGNGSKICVFSGLGLVMGLK